MYITDIRPNKVVEEIVLEVVEKSEPRDIITKYGKEARVCDAVAVDEHGERINLSLWDGEIDRVDVGTRIRITNGWARNFKSRIQISSGLHGRLSIVE